MPGIPFGFQEAFWSDPLTPIPGALPVAPQDAGQGSTALLQAEISIHYAYALIVHPRNRAAVAMHVDNVEQAGVTLHSMGFEVLCEADLAS